MPEELKIKVLLEFKDFLGYQYWLGRKRMIRPLFFVGFLVLFTIGISIFFTGRVDFTVLRAIVLPIFILLLLPLLVWINIYYASKKAFENDPLIRKEQELLFNSTGFRCITENSTTKLTWEEIFKHVETKNNFLIYISIQKAFIIPKRFLDTLKSEELKALLNSRVISKEKKGVFRTEWIIRVVVISIAVAYGIYRGLSGSDTTENYFQNGQSKLEVGDFKGSIIDFSKAIEKNGLYAMAYADRGYAKGMLHDYLGAIEDCNKSISLDPDSDLGYYYRAYAECQSGDSVKGCNDYYKSLKLGNKDAKKFIVYYCKDTIH